MRFSRILLLFAGFLCATASATSKTPDAHKVPRIGYYDVWADREGVSHIATCKLTHFELKSMSPPSDPQWQNAQEWMIFRTMFTIQPPHWKGTWHPNPYPQWIIPLQGRWWVRAMDGTRVEMGPGDVMFGEDIAVRPMQSGPYKGKKGHDAGNVGDGPVELMIVQGRDGAVVNAPCRFH